MMKNKSAAPAKSQRPMPRPRKLAPSKSLRPRSREEGKAQATLDMVARNSGPAPGTQAPARLPMPPTERGMAPSKSQRPKPRPSKFKEGGMVRGCGAAMSGKKYSGTF